MIALGLITAVFAPFFTPAGTVIVCVIIGVLGLLVAILQGKKIITTKRQRDEIDVAVRRQGHLRANPDRLHFSLLETCNKLRRWRLPRWRSRIRGLTRPAPRHARNRRTFWRQATPFRFHLTATEDR